MIFEAIKRRTNLGACDVSREIMDSSLCGFFFLLFFFVFLPI